MISKTLFALTVFTLSAILIVGNKLPQATKPNPGKLLQVNGTVTVNGTNAIAGATAP